MINFDGFFLADEPGKSVFLDGPDARNARRTLWKIHFLNCTSNAFKLQRICIDSSWFIELRNYPESSIWHFNTYNNTNSSNVMMIDLYLLS